MPTAAAANAAEPKKGDARNLTLMTLVLKYAIDMDYAVHLANRKKEACLTDMAEALKTSSELAAMKIKPPCMGTLKGWIEKAMKSRQESLPTVRTFARLTPRAHASPPSSIDARARMTPRPLS